MRLIHVKLARSIWLFDLADLNPKGKDLQEELIKWIKDNYSFAIAPDPDSVNRLGSQSGQAASGLLFQKGHFQVREEVFIEVNLTVYSDGIVIDTMASTHDGDCFAEDLLQSAAHDFGLVYDAETIRKRSYLSELIVRSDLSLAFLHPALRDIAARIGEMSPDDPKPLFQPSGLSFWTDPGSVGNHRMFTLERQVGKAFAERRYYSQAPLHTDDHFKLLEELERILAS